MNEEFDENKIKEQSEEEYDYLLMLFERLLEEYENQTLDLEHFQDIIEARALFAFGYCIRRFGIDIHEALDIIRNYNDSQLPPYERERRKIIIAAMDNLIDFSTAEETQAYMELMEGDYESEEEVFGKYNKTYAITENIDIEYASLFAAWWINLAEQTTLMYMTQGDERVRDSHRALEGLSYPKDKFPEWLIPPIDWRCRCYLVESFSSPNYGDYPDLEKKIGVAVNPIFRESLAKGGAIFSDAHPYFMVDESLVGSMKKISSNIKSKYGLA